jgi:uncharacterized membrane protein (DUF106 family)
MSLNKWIKNSINTFFNIFSPIIFILLIALIILLFILFTTYLYVSLIKFKLIEGYRKESKAEKKEDKRKQKIADKCGTPSRDGTGGAGGAIDNMNGKAKFPSCP